MGSSEISQRPYGANDETMTTGEAASLLGVEVAAVRRACAAYEKNPANGLPFRWTSPDSIRTDRNGRRLRGKRLPLVSEVRRIKRHYDSKPDREFVDAVAFAAAERVKAEGRHP